ncbi:tyrosine-type recombinase/integrase [Vibrio rotiferianus]|uniref:tyrosine-type recombinase/integrase n=1 Tax=Vibrio rotiferianus TaxID=190895 RepID=UPI00148E413E|nr:site-specific integrase [Vibrio rotiferianus]NOH69062.1 tyrosine-type recombinase/integrase [Vibrio rotiferianus]
MSKRISSNATLQSLTPREKEFLVSDKKVEGLSIRVRPTGTMTWVFRFQIGNKHEKISMGRYLKATPERGMTLHQAREEAGRYRGWLANNKNPKIELSREKKKLAEAKTFDDAFISFEGKHLAKQLRGSQSNEIYHRDIKPLIGSTLLSELDISDLNRVFDTKVDSAGKRMSGAIAACHKVISQVINHALALNMIDAHPAPYLKAKDVGGGTSITKRNLSFKELRILLSDIDSWRTDERNIRFLRFLLGSGQRVSAALEMKWSEINLKDRIWLIPASSTDRHTKSKEMRQVPLSGYLIDLLEEQRKAIPHQWALVWPLLNKDQVQEASAIRSIIRRNLPENFEHFSPHDLRRTFISRGSEMRLDFVAVEKVVGHQLPGMSKVYDHHEYFNEQLAALESWGDKLRSLSEENVVPFAVKL